MEQQENSPATAALEQGEGDALLGPDEITATSRVDDDRAMGQQRRRQVAGERQCSCLRQCSREQAHGLWSSGTASVPTLAPERRAAAAGRCTPRRSRGTLKDGRRRPKPCGVCTPAAAAHRRRTARDARETRASGPGQTGWTRLQSAPTHAHRGRTRGLKPLCSLALSLAGKKKGFSTSPRTLAITDRGDRIRTCDLVLPKQTFRGFCDWDFRPQLSW